jgi:hypothetical protein
VIAEPRLIVVDRPGPDYDKLTIVVSDRGMGRTRAWILGQPAAVEDYMAEIVQAAADVMAGSGCSVPRALEIIAGGTIRDKYIPDVVRMSALAVLQDMALQADIHPLADNLAALLETHCTRATP